MILRLVKYNLLVSLLAALAAGVVAFPPAGGLSEFVQVFRTLIDLFLLSFVSAGYLLAMFLMIHLHGNEVPLMRNLGIRRWQVLIAGYGTTLFAALAVFVGTEFLGRL